MDVCIDIAEAEAFDCAGDTIDRVLPRQWSRWRRPCRVCQSAVTVGYDGSASPIMTLHNSLSRPRRKLRYSNGHLADGTREDPLSQKSSSTHIGGKIRYHCSHSRVGPTCRGINVLCIRSPLIYKRRSAARRPQAGQRPRPAEDRFIHTTKNNTSPSGRMVLRSGGPNHSKSCVLESLSQRRFSPIA